MAADYVPLTNLRGPAAVISEATAEVVPATQPADVIMTGLDQDRKFHFKVPRGLDGETVLDNDAAMAQRLLAIDTATHKAALSAASVMVRLDGERWLIIGDSISILGTTLTQGQSYTTFGPWQSGGRVREYARTAVSGMRSDQQLAAVQTLLLAGGPMPTMASILVGTNDLGQGVALSVWQTNVIALVDLLRKVGCEPVLMTLPPRSGPATTVAPAILNGVWNAWLRTYAAAQNIVLVDIWKVVSDPVTGEWRTGWSNPADGVHPTAIAQKAMGDEWIKVVGPHLKSATFPQLDGNSRDGAREAGLPFTAAGAAPTGWTTTGGGTWAVVQDSASPTKYALQLTAANPASRPDAMTKATVAAGDFKPGDTLEVVVKFRIVSGTVAPGFGMRASVVEYTGATSGTQHSVWLFGQSTPTAQYLTARYRLVAGATTDEVRATWQYLKDATGTDAIVANLASMRIYNVTALGLT